MPELPAADIRRAVRLALPAEDRGGEIRQADDRGDEAVGPRRVVGRAQLEDDLVLFAQVERLHVAPLAQIPEMEASLPGCGEAPVLVQLGQVCVALE